MKVSIFASSVRPHLYEAFFNSLKDTSVEHEVVFCGNLEWGDYKSSYIGEKYNSFGFKNFGYVKTNNIKPAQCYEIARRNCIGEVVVWAADDCEFKGDIIGKAYRYWKEQDNRKLILSLQTREADAFRGNMTFFNMKMHSFFGCRPETPLMAPLGMMSREYLEELGGIDQRFITGQYENDIVMRAYEDGGTVEIFGDKEACIEIDHKAKHGGVRAFHSWYPFDRITLEKFWVKDGGISKKRLLPFQGFKENNILSSSQGPKGEWE